MASANPLWGAPRIHGELRTLGIDVSETHRVASAGAVSPFAVANLEDLPQDHIASAASLDFFTVPTLTGRILFVLVVLSHERRRILHVNVTKHPTAEWSAQQLVDAFPDKTAPRWLHRDRDRIHGAAFQRRVA
jgi:putative transposase